VENNIHLQEFNFYHEKTIEVGRYVIPLKIHIKDINDSHITRIRNRRYGEVLDMSQNHFDKAYEELEKDAKIQYYLKFINTEDKLFKNNLTFLTYNYLKNIDDILDKIDLKDFQVIVNSVDDIMKDMIVEFFDIAKSFLGADKIQPSISLEKTNDVLWDKVMAYLDRPQGYLIAQLGIEFRGTPFFKENIDKAISDWSFRELQLHLMYISEKHKTDGTLEKYKAKKQEDAMKENKK